jgi:twitching motility protein PilT
MGDEVQFTKQFGASSMSDTFDMKYLIKALVKYSASDLHLKVGRPPLFRINGKLIPAKMPELSQQSAETLLLGLLSAKQVLQLEDRRQIDFSFRMKDYGRFRCNVYYQKECISAAIRIIPLTVPNIDQLGIPPIVKELSLRPRGLLLITGSTGSGKSTTLSGMIQHINETRNVHVLTIEDPIEFVYKDIKASITQREVGSDINSLQDGLYGGLRQDPDVMMIGELRDCHMIEAAFKAAETGHLVISTMHTNDAKSSLDRLLEVFPAEYQNQARTQLASTLVGIISQQLVPRADGTGRVPACEVLVKSPVIEHYIMKQKMELIPEAIANSNDYYKMQTMNQSLEGLVRGGLISIDEALKCSSAPEDLRLLLAGIKRDDGFNIAV